MIGVVKHVRAQQGVVNSDVMMLTGIIWSECLVMITHVHLSVLNTVD